MYAATYRTVCYGWRVGIVKSIVIVTVAAVYYLTLPYLTIPWISVYSTLLYYITLDQPNFSAQSVAKTHKTLVFPHKNGGYSEETLRRRGFTGP